MTDQEQQQSEADGVDVDPTAIYRHGLALIKSCLLNEVTLIFQGKKASQYKLEALKMASETLSNCFKIQSSIKLLNIE